MALDSRVVWFADKRAAYGYVAELRRLYDLGRWQDLWVHRTSDGALVEIPLAAWVSVPLSDLTRRFGGWAPAGGEELDRLRSAVVAARRSNRESMSRDSQTDRRAGQTPSFGSTAMPGSPAGRNDK